VHESTSKNAPQKRNQKKKVASTAMTFPLTLTKMFFFVIVQVVFLNVNAQAIRLSILFRTTEEGFLILKKKKKKLKELD
jgi:hypothetical protein